MSSSQKKLSTSPLEKTNTNEWVFKAFEFAVPSEADDRLSFAQSLVFNTVAAFWDEMSKCSAEGGSHQLRPLPGSLTLSVLSAETLELVQNIGRKTACLDVANASYAIGRIHTETMPKERRSKLGAYYTPPALCERLLDMASQAGVDWSTARVLDPACGGGAFLSPVARRMAASVKETESEAALESIESRLYGIELDPFAAWLSQVFLDATLTKLGIVSNRLPRISVQVEDALECKSADREFDLVVGNPPYGRLIRLVFSHTNLARCEAEAIKLASKLRQQQAEWDITDADILGPMPAFPTRLRGRFRWHIILRGANPRALLDKVDISKGWVVDIDPVALT